MDTPWFTLPVRGGSVARIGLQLKDMTGATESLTGRLFSWVVLDSAGETLAAEDAIIETYEGSATAFMALNGADILTFLGPDGEAAQRDSLVVERVTGGYREHVRIVLPVSPGVALADLPAEPPDAAGPFTLIVLEGN